LGGGAVLSSSAGLDTRRKPQAAPAALNARGQ
jgi:hypothetical protein